MTRCLTDEVVLQLVEGRLSADAAAGAQEHIKTCADCAAVVAETARFFFPDPRDADAAAASEAAAEPSATSSPTIAGRSPPGSAVPLGPRAKVSRYEIGEPLGIGGGGIVYRAYDPQLRRHVALKLIRQVAASAAEQERLLREAHAMARLSHPNVVNVHDAGTLGDEAFIVMELVEGITLGAWLKEQRRSVRDVLAVFMDAGRGLAAAHAAGLVHRDFKPENVLIGAEGRVRVSDFGLARAVGSALEPAGTAAATGAAPAAARASSIAGTPLYMAPEQFLGKSADARTDQFSFCVALYVALYGEHPFGEGKLETQTVKSLARAVTAGRLRPTPPSDLPAGLREVLERGLAVDPKDRFSTMDDLLGALGERLASGEPRSWRRWLRSPAALTAATVLVLGAGFAAWRLLFGQVCGNGVLEGNEACDDGNSSNTDGCLATCRFATCGDGHVRKNIEECDDGNRRDGDGCASNCLACGPNAASGGFFYDETGGCYTRHTTPLRWGQARDTCRGLGGDLAAYWTNYEANAVAKALLASDRGTLSWIALRRTDMWETGELPRYFSWAEGDPLVVDGKCAAEALPPKGQRSRWSFVDCTEPHTFVCERAPWITRPKDNHAYRFSYQHTVWQNARERCEQAGGHLATIADFEEHAFLAGPVGLRDVWIGAFDVALGPNLKWVTGEPFAYHRFAPREPDNVKPGAPACVVLGRDKNWHDRPCQVSHPYVCEID